MKRAIIFPALLALSLTGFAQNAIYRLSTEVLRDTSNAEEVSTSLTFTGEYREAIRFADKDAPVQRSNAQDSAYFSSFRPYDAHKYIVEQAAQHRVIFIDGDNTKPQHRVFVQSLLGDLYKLGFRYFAFEALDAEDTLLNQRRYPASHSGYHVNEPRYGELVRAAIKTGYRAVSYDYYADDNISPETVGDTIRLEIGRNNRELHQAMNLHKILLKDPGAKIVVFCSLQHASEKQGFMKPMSIWFRELTAIDPLTIDQVTGTERSRREIENPFFRMSRAESPSVFVGTGGKTLEPSRDHQFDMYVFHPRTVMKDNRPHWLPDNRKKFFLKKKHTPVNCPCIVSAVYPNESPGTAVPADVMEIKTPDEKKPLILPRGTFMLRLENIKGLTSQFMIKVK